MIRSDSEPNREHRDRVSGPDLLDASIFLVCPSPRFRQAFESKEGDISQSDIGTDDVVCRNGVSHGNLNKHYSIPSVIALPPDFTSIPSV